MSPSTAAVEGATGDQLEQRMEPATLAVLVKRFPRRSETFVLGEVLELRRQGLPLRLLAIMDPTESWSQPEAKAMVHEVEYLRSGSWWRSLPALSRTAARHPTGTVRAARWALSHRSWAAWRRFAEGLVLVAKLEDGGGPVHVHAHFANGPAADAYVAHLVAGIAYSFTAHAKDLYTTPVPYLAERCRAASFVATCTETNGRYLTEVVGLNPSALKVCPHGVDLERFASIQRRPVAGRILSIGRLVPKKGFDVLVEACGHLARRGIDFECRIVGDGPIRAALEEQIRVLGLQEHVRIEPGRPQAELLDALAEAALFAIAPVIQADGDRDGIPNVILEALTAGVPVVSTRVSGIPEVIQDGDNGRLVDPEDPVALSAALGELLTDDSLCDRLGRAATRIAAGRDWASCTRPLLAALETALAAAGGPAKGGFGRRSSPRGTSLRGARGCGPP